MSQYFGSLGGRKSFLNLVSCWDRWGNSTAAGWRHRQLCSETYEPFPNITATRLIWSNKGSHCIAALFSRYLSSHCNRCLCTSLHCNEIPVEKFQNLLVTTRTPFANGENQSLPFEYGSRSVLAVFGKTRFYVKVPRLVLPRSIFRSPGYELLRNFNGQHFLKRNLLF